MTDKATKSASPGPGVKCPKCGEGGEACMYCRDLAAPDWEAICDCGLWSHGFHLIACEISKGPK